MLAPRLGLQRVRGVGPQVVPGDRQADGEAQDERTGQSDERQSRVEGDVRPQRQMVGAEHGQEADARGPDGEPEQSARRE